MVRPWHPYHTRTMVELWFDYGSLIVVQLPHALTAVPWYNHVDTVHVVITQM